MFKIWGLILFFLLKLIAVVPLPFETIDHGTTSGLRLYSNFTHIIRSNNLLRDVWERHSSHSVMPEVNFKDEMVACVFLGKNNSRTITVKEVEQNDNGIVLKYETSELGDGVTEKSIQPYHIIKMKALDVPVQFEEKSF
uniref:Uncharacterized protein n=1 Tax=Corethron hystrix TaxID=216773 RepID=A0A7S1FUZ3_9STRA|mmetsp:Transcript_30082/g.68979  ORF Transcript_30082/g.68979 Transcript_30082/m.68979 type:complete len:139 (+) Transcript_30082:136-552(+)